MAKFKKYSYEQQLLLLGCMGEQQYSATSPVYFENQILPGTFEYTLNMLINEKFDLAIFYDKFKNDIEGAPAYDPLVAESQ